MNVIVFLYLDECDSGWDALYVKYNERMTVLAENKGYSESKGTLMVRYRKESGHNKWFWQQHCSVPLEFLLKAHVAGIESVEARVLSSAMIFNLNGVGMGIDPDALTEGVYIQEGKKFLKR